MNGESWAAQELLGRRRREREKRMNERKYGVARWWCGRDVWVADLRASPELSTFSIDQHSPTSRFSPHPLSLLSPWAEELTTYIGLTVLYLCMV